MQVSWFKDGQRVHSSDRHNPESHGTLVMLRIRRVRPADFGNYSCQAENSQGVSRDHIELTGNQIAVLKFTSVRHWGTNFCKSLYIDKRAQRNDRLEPSPYIFIPLQEPIKRNKNHKQRAETINFSCVCF